jgi:predicted MFS family arabinose efflux permease
VVRQSLAALSPSDRQVSAFALDSIGTEFTYMIAPAAGVVLATAWSALGAVVVLGVVTVLAGLALLIVNPPLRPPGQGPSSDLDAGWPAMDTPAEPQSLSWLAVFNREIVIVLIATVAALAVLAGTEVAVVAFLRERGQGGLSSLVFILWSVSSAIGGLLLGARQRPVPVFLVLLGLGVLTIPVGLVPGSWWLVLAILPTGFFCAPTLAATAAAVSRLAPHNIRGEVMGWYGTGMTTGLAIGAPLAGFAIDHAGPWAGFALIGTLGTVVAVVGLVLVPWGIDRPDPKGSGAPSGVSPTRRLRSAD